MTSELIRLLLSQFMAYLLSNFIIIPNRYVQEVKLLGNKYWRSITRMLVFFVFSFLLSHDKGFVLLSILLATIIGVINFFSDKKSIGTSAFIVAHAVQLIAVFIIVHLYDDVMYSYNLFEVVRDFTLADKNMWIITAYLLCLGPANVLIKLLLRGNGFIPEEPEKANTLLKAGRFIGNIERVITITLVFNDQYEAIGLLIAAKSLLRLKEND